MLAQSILPVLIDQKKNLPGHSASGRRETQVDSDDNSSEITLFGGVHAFKAFDHNKYLDYDTFPESDKNVLISWRKFTRDF